MMTIRQAWSDLERVLIAGGGTPDQVAAMKSTFVAGAAAALQIALRTDPSAVSVVSHTLDDLAEMRDNLAEVIVLRPMH